MKILRKFTSLGQTKKSEKAKDTAPTKRTSSNPGVRKLDQPQTPITQRTVEASAPKDKLDKFIEKRRSEIPVFRYANQDEGFEIVPNKIITDVGQFLHEIETPIMLLKTKMLTVSKLSPSHVDGSRKIINQLRTELSKLEPFEKGRFGLNLIEHLDEFEAKVNQLAPKQPDELGKF